MNEDIRKNEIGEEQLENVSGGCDTMDEPSVCSWCGGELETRMYRGDIYYRCKNCGYTMS